jgi:5-formyltetrahydrofolate cyclo-ligase
MAARRRAVPEERARAAGGALAERLAASPELQRARRIALYAASGGELPTAALEGAARALGLGVLWPRVSGRRLEFAACEGEALLPGAFGIAEPPGELPAQALGAGDLVLLPSLALDAGGGRLGRGGGYYDRAFADAVRGPFLVGVGYDFQLVDEVPAGVGDGRVDMVATEERLIRTRVRERSV